VSKKQITIIFIAIAIFLGMRISSVSAATFYVSNSGKDSNPGTSEAQPWKTIDKVNKSAFQPGDSVLLKRGDLWREQLRIVWSGVDGSPVTFGDYGTGDLPMLHGGTIIPPSDWVGPDAQGIYSYSLGYNIGNFSEDSVVLPQASDETLKDGNWFIFRSAIAPYPSTVYYRPSSGTPANHITDRVGRGTCVSFDSGNNSYVTIQNISAFLCVGIYATASNGSLHDITVKGSSFKNAGIQFITRNGNGNSHITIIGNQIINAPEGVYVGGMDNGPENSDYVTIFGNTIKDTGILVDSKHTGGDEEGIGLQNISNSVISDNEIFGGAKGGGISYWTNMNAVDATNNQFSRNYIHDILGSGIIPGGSGNNNSNATVTNNIIAHCSAGPPASYSKYNGGLRLNRAQSGSSLIANNTVFDCDVGINLYSLPDNYVIKNNLILGNRQENVAREGNGIFNNILSNNLYYPNGSNLFFYVNKFYDLAGWQNITHQDANSISADSQFLNPSGNFSQPSDFKLQASSPAIDAGADVGLTSDFEGTPVPQGASPDIGAFEYSSGSPTYDNSDLNQDNSVDSADLDILKSDFLKLTANLSNSRSDINSDGQCTVRDLGILMSGWK
jgi:parallel beta-helix repeat protein